MIHRSAQKFPRLKRRDGLSARQGLTASSMEWWVDNPARWHKEEEQMSRWFPLSQWTQLAQKGTITRRWEAVIEPIPPPEDLPLVIADLDRDGWVDIEPNGKIRHLSGCHAEHPLRAGFEGIDLTDEAFLVELTYSEPPMQPQARCLVPQWSRLTIPDHSHFYQDGDGDIICPLFPPDDDWQWRKNTASDYLAYVAIWLLKTSVWLAVKIKLGNRAWIGSSVHHSLDALLRIHPEQCCPCGSGRKFKQCHMRLYALAHNQKRRGG